MSRPLTLPNLPLLLDEWVQPQFRVFSLVLLWVLALHAAALFFVPVAPIREPVFSESSVMATLHLPGAIGSNLRLGADPEFLLRYNDPSAMARADVTALPARFHGVRALMPLPPRPRPVAAPRVDSWKQEKESVGELQEAAVLARKLFERPPSEQLPRRVFPLTTSPAAAAAQTARSSEPGGRAEQESARRAPLHFYFSQNVQSRQPQTVPEIQAVPVDQPLQGPSRFQVCVMPDGSVSTLFLQSSCGVLLLDQQAGNFIRALRFQPAPEAQPLWGSVSLFWPQRAALPDMPATTDGTDDRTELETAVEHGETFSF